MTSETQTGVRLALAAEGEANVATGLPVLDHFVAELARTARFKLSLEVAPGSADAVAAAAGRALGEAIGERLRAPRAAASGWALVPAEEALASAALELSERPLVVTNVDFSDQSVGGLSTDVASRFLRELADAAHLNLHVRLVEGTDPQHELAAIFKAVGAALGQACRPVPDAKEDS
ncbi:MAG: imidazoleglycerol-phosphate dehydratase [Gaiellaceae bacterium]|nr:imidazoleglycerol-phosphate dehydratase [Gaiellaceae bacterium]